MNRHVELLVDTVTPELAALPYCNLLPTDEIGLLRWRYYARKRCLEDPAFRDLIWQACAADVVFFVQTFVYFHETRETEKQLGEFPAICDSQQRNLLALFQRRAGLGDMTVEKTRGIGVSYLIACHLIWVWLFKAHRALEYGVVSKDDASLDMVGRPSTLMGKLDLIFEELPHWMKVDREGKSILHRTLKNHRFEHLVTKCAITGYTASDEKLRSARLYFLFSDESAFMPVEDQRWLAAAHGTVPSIIYVSTHTGTATMFYHLTRETKKDLLRVSCWWWENERCRPGLYKSEKGRIELLDPGYVYPLDYEFSHDTPGLHRSPWADRAFNRPGANQQTVLEELYGLAGALNRKLIRPALVERLRTKCKPPVTRYTIEDETFVEDVFDGDWYFWDVGPYRGTYFVGVDPALGSKGGAYAGVYAFDVVTGEQVASARLENCGPVDLARYVVVLAKHLAGPRGAGFAKVAYECTGIGASFGTELTRLRWPAIAHEEGKDAGGFANADKGEKWLVELCRALQDKDIENLDYRLLDDLEAFEYDHDFKLCFSSINGHGDLGIGAGIAWFAARKMRRGILERKPEKQAQKQGIEHEPLFAQRKKEAQTWSNRFRTNRI